MCFPLNFAKLIPPASTCTAGAALAAGSSCTLVMQFNPTLSAGTKSATLTLTDNAVPTTQVITLSGTIITAAPPTVSFTSPTANTNLTAPGSFTLTANASAPSSSVTQVDYYANGTMIGSATTAPYSFNWNTVPTGLYSLTALVTDALGRHAISPSVIVAVSSGATTSTQAYYIHTDHLDTPRVITDAAGNKVWEWGNVDPFGNNMANENPNGVGAFNFNMRFPGQYYDRETNLHYNYFRDCYDPATGRYCQSDPIGLRGGVNTFGYANQNPLRYNDPSGLRSPAGIGAGLICLIAEGYYTYDDYQALRDTLNQINKINQQIAGMESSCPVNAGEEERQRRQQEIDDLKRQGAALAIKSAAQNLKFGMVQALAVGVCGVIAGAL